jgi:UDP-N-acetylglucosamine--dolichyl-phosphate N-acetylglucosaminephosphotransferase
MNLLLAVPILLAFFLSFNGIPKWIKKCKQSGYLWEDMNKFKSPKRVAGSGGFVVIVSFILGVLSYVAIRTFLIDSTNGTSLEIFSLLAVILILTVVGLTDDFLGWRQRGLSKRFRLFFAFLAATPLVVINAGTSMINLPFLGSVNLGFLYPLILIPIGIAGATAGFNMLAGFNGLEAGQGIIIITFLSIVAYLTNSPWLALIGLIMVSTLAVFYFYNKYPAKVFPGDALTWSIGALIAVMAILGDFERIALFVYIPYFIEAGLKLRGKLEKESFAKPNKDGSLEMPYKKVYGMILIMKGFKKKVYEKDITYLIFAFQVIMCILALLIFDII